MEAFLASRASTDPLADDYVRSTRRITTENGRKAFRQIASALVLSGAVELETVTGLIILVEIENVRRMISYLRDEKQGGEITASHENLVWLLRMVAQHWLKDAAAAEQIKALLTALRKHFGPERRPWAQADEPRAAAPVRRDSERGGADRPAHSFPPLRKGAREPTYRQSVRLMQALQVGLLTFVPIRSNNLIGLKLATNLIDTRKGAKRSVRIRLGASETKTYRDYEAPVPAHLHPMLDLWLKEHRQRVCLADSPYLFPNSRGPSSGAARR